MIDFSKLQPKRNPTRKEAARYRRWLRYLSDSKLSEAEVYSRAASYTGQGLEPKND